MTFSWKLIRIVISQESIIKIDNVEIDPQKFDVRVDGKSITLAKKEFELLHLLASTDLTAPPNSSVLTASQ